MKKIFDKSELEYKMHKSKSENVLRDDSTLFKMENPKPNKELIEAIKEGEDILSGKIQTKTYTDMYEMIEDLKK